MTYTQEVPQQMLGIWKTYLETLKTAEEQSDKMLTMMLGQSDAFQAEAKKVVDQWIDNSKKINKNYIDNIEQNIQKFEETISPKS